MFPVCCGLIGCTKRMPVRCPDVAHLCFFLFLSLSLSIPHPMPCPCQSAQEIWGASFIFLFYYSVHCPLFSPSLCVFLYLLFCVFVSVSLSYVIFVFRDIQTTDQLPHFLIDRLVFFSKRHTLGFCRPGDTLWVNFVRGASWLSSVKVNMQRHSQAILLPQCDEIPKETRHSTRKKCD